VSGRLVYVTDVSPYHDPSGTRPMRERLAGAHGVLGQSVTAVAELARAVALDFVHVPSVLEMPAGTLEGSTVLALFTIGETPWSESDRASIASRLRSGQLSIFGLHSASDSCAGWDDFGGLLGARFDGHPWTQRFGIETVDSEHPSTSHLPAQWQFMDELYLFRDLRSDARVLLRAPGDDLDMRADGARRPPIGFPLAWCFSEGAGRVFYTALGHFPGAYEDVRFLGHLYGGLEWLLARDS
jgi:type 1 glutamine amidotransferase